MKYTITTLKKIEDLFKALGYTVRYEKGQFQSGYCIVEGRNIIVVNKFFDTEGRINCFMEALSTIPPDSVRLSHDDMELYLKFYKNKTEE